jgi:hydroxymethylpyrimidine pyrophosphatase-like HAD family hydrolase
MSDDSHARTSDLALDIGESQKVPADVVAAIEAAAHGLGMRTFVSSVHLHLTLDPFDKASGTLAFLTDRFGEDPTAARHRYAYIGDSANDAACFFAFPMSFGVANVRPNLLRLSVAPRYVADAQKGAGFAEICDRILALRA